LWKEQPPQKRSTKRRTAAVVPSRSMDLYFAGIHMLHDISSTPLWVVIDYYGT
jgi:hypothetical protein